MRIMNTQNLAIFFPMYSGRVQETCILGDKKKTNKQTKKKKKKTVLWARQPFQEGLACLVRNLYFCICM